MMSRRGDLDKALLVFLLFFAILIIGIYLSIAAGLAAAKHPATMKENLFSISSSSLFTLPLLVHEGQLIELAPSDAATFAGEKFVESDYRIVPAEQKQGYLAGSGKIFGIRDVQDRHITFVEGLLAMQTSEHDFSYARYVLEDGVARFLANDTTFAREPSTCFFASIGQNGAFRPVFFERSQRTGGGVQNMVARKGIDTASFLYQMPLREYQTLGDHVRVSVQGKIVDVYGYYGRCL